MNNNTRVYPRTMEEAFGPGHRSSYGIEPMHERGYSPAWYVCVALCGLVALVFAWVFR